MLRISEICKVASNVAQCANSLRNTKKFKFAKLSNFRNLQNSRRNCQMYQFVERYEKNPRLTNLQTLEIRKIVPKVTKCADSWRNTEK